MNGGPKAHSQAHFKPHSLLSSLEISLTPLSCNQCLTGCYQKSSSGWNGLWQLPFFACLAFQTSSYSWKIFFLLSRGRKQSCPPPEMLETLGNESFPDLLSSLGTGKWIRFFRDSVKISPGDKREEGSYGNSFQGLELEYWPCKMQHPELKSSYSGKSGVFPSPGYWRDVGPGSGHTASFQFLLPNLQALFCRLPGDSERYPIFISKILFLLISAESVSILMVVTTTDPTQRKVSSQLFATPSWSGAKPFQVP